MPLNENNASQDLEIGLRDLKEEDIQEISEEAFTIIRKKLEKRVSPSKIDSYDIVIDIDNSQEQLRIDIDIISLLVRRNSENEQRIIDQTLEETFTELDKFLKEKYSC
jgi:hypothetical protein